MHKLSIQVRSIALAMLFISLAPAVADEPKPLFNGNDLSGWVQRGGKAKYTIEGDTIVGTAVAGTPNSFLCTDRNYENFVLELDFKVDDGLNSGIQIRSECYDEDRVEKVKTKEGKTVEKKFPAGRVHGYQVEIDASPRSWSGGIYDEARRGWLDDLSADEDSAAREAFKSGEWNHYRIEARGPSLKVTLNGVPAGQVEDDLTPTGFIALQVHAIGNKKEAGKQIRWRNITIEELKD